MLLISWYVRIFVSSACYLYKHFITVFRGLSHKLHDIDLIEFSVFHATISNIVVIYSRLGPGATFVFNSHFQQSSPGLRKGVGKMKYSGALRVLSMPSQGTIDGNTGK